MAFAIAPPISRLKLLTLTTGCRSNRRLGGRRLLLPSFLAAQFTTLCLIPRRLRPPHLVVGCAAEDGSGSLGADSAAGGKDFESGASGAGYVGLFIRMLGMDNDPLDREQAIITLWEYSQGGKHCIDEIMQYPGCITLTISLLQSEYPSTCEAAVGLLRTISSVSLYFDSIAASGAIEAVIGLLSRSSLTENVKEQTLCTLWNLSVDEKLRNKIATVDLLPALVKFLDDEEVKVQEAAGGVLANLALDQSNHSIMFEAGVIQKLAKILKDEKASKVAKKEAKSILLEMAKDEYYRIVIIEEDLVLVPLIGTAAYKSFKPMSKPSLPDGTEFEFDSSIPSKYGASKVLVGLNLKNKSFNMEEAKMNSIIGYSRQQFLARIGVIELEGGSATQLESPSNEQHTILPWIDGVARLVLILQLQDKSAVARAAQSIADAAINEHMRISFKEAGAVRHLIPLLGHENDDVKVAAAHALEKLAVSNEVYKLLETEAVLDHVVDMLKNVNRSSLVEKAVNLLARILDPNKEMKKKFHDGSSDESKEVSNAGTMHFEGITRKKVLNHSVLTHLMEILKTPNPNLQKNAASILEYLAITEPHELTTAVAEIESGLVEVFQQSFHEVPEENIEENMDIEPELSVAQAEEIGSIISASSRLLTKLLDIERFSKSINSKHLIHILRKVLKSSIPVHAKDWVAACLVKLISSFGLPLHINNPINMEVTLYGTIPKLLEHIKTSSFEMQEAAAVELNSLVSRGGVDFTRVVAEQGGIFPLVKMLEDASGSGLEACLAILYNLSMDSENHSAIIAAGAIPLLRRIVLSECPQSQRALHLLRTLPT